MGSCCSARSRSQTIHGFRQTGLVASGGIPGDYALSHRLINQAESLGQEGLRIGLLAGSHNRLQLLDLSSKLVPVHLINEAAALALTMSL
jgi:hypothetical protein